MSQNPYNNELVSQSWLLNMEDQRSDFHKQSHIDLVSQWINNFKPVNLLEVGCGDGFLSRIPDMREVHYTGLDESPWFIEHGQTQNRNSTHQFVAMDLLKYQENKKYESALACMVWCTFAEPLAALKKLHSLLGPGARALLTMPCAASRDLWLKSFVRQHDEKTFIHRYGHPKLGFEELPIFLHSNEEMSEAFFRAGFKLIEQRDFGIPPASKSAVYTAFDISST